MFTSIFVCERKLQRLNCYRKKGPGRTPAAEKQLFNLPACTTQKSIQIVGMASRKQNGSSMIMTDVHFTVWDTNMYGGVRAIFEVAKRLTIRGHRVQITSLMGDHRWFPINVPITYVNPPILFKLTEQYISFRHKLRYHSIRNKIPLHDGDIQLMEKRIIASSYTLFNRSYSRL